MASLKAYLLKLRLKVNEAKLGDPPVGERSFLATA